MSLSLSLPDSPTIDAGPPSAPEFPPFRSNRHRRLRKQVEEAFDYAEDGKRDHDEIARRSYKHFSCFINDADWQFDTKVVDPKYAADLLTHCAREVQAVMQAPPLMRFAPRGGTRYLQAQQMTDVCAYFTDVLPLWENYINVSLQRRMFGTVWGHTHWRTEERLQSGWERRPLMDPLTGQPLRDPFTGELVEVVEHYSGKRIVFDGPDLTVLHWSNAYPDPMTENLRGPNDTDAFFCTRYMRPRKYLQRKLKTGEWGKDALNQLLSKRPRDSGGGRSSLDSLFQTLDWQNQIGLSKPMEEKSLESRDWFEVVERWTPETHTILVNREFVVLHRPNPFPHGRLPFVHLRNYHVPGEHYGRPDFQFIESLITSSIEMRNVEATVALLSAFPVLKYGPTVNPSQLVIGPGATFRVEGGDKDILEFMNHPSGGVQVAQLVRNSNGYSMDNLTGLSDALRGSTASGETTATEVTIAAQSGGLRSQMAIDSIDHCFTRDVADDWQAMIRCWLPNDVTTRITGDPMGDPVTIPIDDLRDAMLIAVPTASSNQARLLEEKRVEAMYNLFVTTQEPNVDRRALVEMYLDVVAPRYKQRILRSQEQMQAEQQQQMMQAMAMQQAQQGQGQDPSAQGGYGRNGVQASAAAQGRQLVEPAPAREDVRMSDMSEYANDVGAEMRG